MLYRTTSKQLKKLWNWPYVHSIVKKSLFFWIFWAVYFVWPAQEKSPSNGNGLDIFHILQTYTAGFAILRPMPQSESLFSFVMIHGLSLCAAIQFLNQQQ